MMRRAIVLGGLACVLWAIETSGQCCGDCDGDGQITVNELVAAVGRALNGCPVATPTATPTTAPERFIDNGDGTISDQETGLMWEKKIGLDGAVDGFELHDADNRYPWTGACSGATPVSCRTDADCPGQETCNANDQQRTKLTVFQWIEEVNRENGVGYVGFSDWRVPTIDELRTLRASPESVPATHEAFHGQSCGTTCTEWPEPACSCTSPNPYWSVTSLDSDPAWAWRVDFRTAEVLPNRKTDKLLIRAVRRP